MSERQCPHCARTLTVDQGAAFCPFCGKSLQAEEATQQDEALRRQLLQIEEQSDPVKKYKLLKQLQEQYPNSLPVAEELLFLGRLHERSAKAIDFSVIKSYLLNIYLEPGSMKPEQMSALRKELFDHPDLERCLALAGDRDVFLNRYLTRLSGQFIHLFLQGSSKYMRRFFGFSVDSRAAKMLAPPAARMLAMMRQDMELTGEQRDMLMHAFYAAFSAQLNGDTQWLQKDMAELGISL